MSISVEFYELLRKARLHSSLPSSLFDDHARASRWKSAPLRSLWSPFAFCSQGILPLLVRGLYFCFVTLHLSWR